MKYAHIEKDTSKLLGWYDNEIHKSIPTPNIEATEKIWKEALEISANFYNIETNTFEIKDFSTIEEKTTALHIQFTSSIESYIQSEINKYNENNSLKFKNIDSIYKYTSAPSYTHYDFCVKIIAWNIEVWEVARDMQEQYEDGTIEIPTQEEVLEQLPDFETFKV